MKTYMLKTEDAKEKWYLVDAEGEVLGRLASRIASVLRGKNSPEFTPHANIRHHVVVVNAEKIRLTGDKWESKVYYHHTGWIGGLKATTPRQLMEKKPTEVLRKAVWGMLPHNRLGHATMKRLRLFAGPEHEHEAQQPVAIKLTK
jgi:large subunit ribosomal protein L13